MDLLTHKTHGLWRIAAVILSVLSVANAIPSQITYQGSLKQKQVPAADGSYTMLFRLTNGDGSQLYWSSGNLSVTITKGLFSVPLAPMGVDWQHVTPYIELTINGQLMLPREPVTSTVYAAISADVVDNAITTPKLADGAVTQAKLDPLAAIPSGLIGLFAGPCPTGWNRFSALDNTFPMGGASYGATGGSPTHSHYLGLPTSVATNQWLFGNPQGSGSHSLDLALSDHVHTVSSSSNMPPFLTVVFCQKQ